MTRTITTLGDAARFGMVLRIECRACQHTANFMASDVAQFSHRGHALEAIRFACTECKARDFIVTPYELDRDRMPSIVVWRPTRLK